MNIRHANILASRLNADLIMHQQGFDQIKFSPYGAPSLSYVVRKAIYMAIDHDDFENFLDAFDQSIGGLYRGSTSSARHEDFQMIFDIADMLLVAQ